MRNELDLYALLCEPVRQTVGSICVQSRGMCAFTEACVPTKHASQTCRLAKLRTQHIKHAGCVLATVPSQLCKFI